MKHYIYISFLASIILLSFCSCRNDDSVNVEGITLNKSVMNLIEDESETLVATISPSNADNKACLWSSSNTDIASVNDAGKVTAVRKGETTIKVTTIDGGKTATCKVVVEAKYIAVTEIRLSETSVVLHAGESHILTAQVSPAEATDKSMAWKSSDESVATIDANGIVSGIKTGRTTITASAENGKVTASCDVVVEPTAVTGVSIQMHSLSLVVNEEIQLSYDITPENADDKSVIWSVEDESVAKIGPDGKVTAMKVGQTTATVKTNDGGYMDQCLIKVVEITELITGKTSRVGSVFINGVEFPSNNLVIELVNNSNQSIILNSVQVIDIYSQRATNILNLGGIELGAKQEYMDVLSLSSYWDNPVVRWRYTYNGIDYISDCALAQ